MSNAPVMSPGVEGTPSVTIDGGPSHPLQVERGLEEQACRDHDLVEAAGGTLSRDEKAYYDVRRQIRGEIAGYQTEQHILKRLDRVDEELRIIRESGGADDNPEPPFIGEDSTA